jgi:hypothetical protein
MEVFLLKREKRKTLQEMINNAYAAGRRLCDAISK